MPPGFVNGDGDGIGEVEAALAGPHGQAQAHVGVKAVADGGRQAGAFRAKDQPVTRLKTGAVHRALTARAQGKQAIGRRLFGSAKMCPAGVAPQLGIFVVIEAGSAQQFVFHGETQGLNQVQAAARVGGQPDHVAGVGRDFRVDQDDVEHGLIVPCVQTPGP